MAKMDYRKRMYDAQASTLGKYTHSLTPKDYEYARKVYRRRFMPFLPEDKDARIMDVACGAGHLLYFLQKEGYRQTQGIDISQEVVELASRLGVQNIEAGDLFQYLPRHKEEFDFISANDFIEHLKKDEVLEFLDLVYAALKPGGITRMGTPNVAGLFGSRAVFVSFGHETGFAPKSLREVFRLCGFENVMVYGEEPVAHNLRSAILWKFIRGLMKVCLRLSGASGIGMRTPDGQLILEPHIFVVARKPGR